MNMKQIIPVLALIAGTISMGITTAQARIQTGILTCDVMGGVGMVVASSKAVSCTFKGAGERTDQYTGTIRKFGVDLGFTGKSRIVWSVFEDANRSGSIAGTYTGASAEATVAVGLGANVLLGGGDGAIALQPLSVQAQTGLNVAAGAVSLTLNLVDASSAAKKIKPVHHHKKKAAHTHHHKQR